MSLFLVSIEGMYFVQNLAKLVKVKIASYVKVKQQSLAYLINRSN